MKKCKYCQTEIEKKAKICPHCRKKQGIPKWIIVLLVVIGLVAINSFNEGDSSTKEEQKTGTTNNSEKISLLDGHSGSVESSYT